MKRYFFIIIFSLSVLVGRCAWAEATITVCGFGGSYNKAIEEAIVKPFTQATGIKVIVTAWPDYAKMAGQVKTDNIEWDIVEAEDRFYFRGIKDGIFERLDLSMISTKDFVEGSVLEYGVGFDYFSYLISYRTDKWPAGKGPKSLKDFWDVKTFPGPRTMKSTAMASLEAALMADGVPKNKLYPMDVDRALKKLKELKPYIRVYWKTGGQAQQIIREREADLGYVPGCRMIELAEQGIPIAWEWTDQIILLDRWTILRGTKKKNEAMKFIAFASDPKIQAAFAQMTNYGPSNKKAYDYIRKEKAVLMPTYPENFAKGAVMNGEWYGKYEEEVERRWEAWKME